MAEERHPGFRWEAQFNIVDFVDEIGCYAPREKPVHCVSLRLCGAAYENDDVLIGYIDKMAEALREQLRGEERAGFEPAGHDGHPASNGAR